MGSYEFLTENMSKTLQEAKLPSLKDKIDAEEAELEAELKKEKKVKKPRLGRKGQGKK